MNNRNELDPIGVACLLADALELAGLPFAIGGAIAYGFWGVPRGTLDVDLNIFVTHNQIEEVLQALSHVGCQLDAAKARRSAVERGDLRGKIGSIRVDVFLNSISIHERASQRVVMVELAGRKLPILSAEDLLAFKLLFDRLKDRVDAEGLIVGRRDELDLEYVRKCLRETVGETDSRLIWLDDLIHRIDAGRE